MVTKSLSLVFIKADFKAFYQFLKLCSLQFTNCFGRLVGAIMIYLTPHDQMQKVKHFQDE